jgi:hypothetical protein
VKRIVIPVLALVAAAGAVGVGLAATPASSDPTEVMPAAGPDGAVSDRPVPANQSPAHLPSAGVPRPVPLAVTGPGAELGVHFNGLSFHDQRRQADGGNQLSIEPPDQALCVGNGELIEGANSLFATYDAATGAQTSGFESMNQFFIGDHQIDRSVNPPQYGTYVSDPRCVYDPQSNRFFMSILSFGRDPSTGAFHGPGTIRLAASRTGTPTTSPSDWSFTTIDVTNSSHPGCPCFGDQPLLGLDANGVYLTTNEFPINGPGFNGAQIYAIGKAALVAGTTPNIVRIEGAPIASTGYGGVLPYSLQPTTSPSAGDFATANGGTEYLVGALGSQLDNRIAVWALTNTSSLDSATPSIHVADTVISSETYGFPPAIVQPNGPTPVADSFKQHENLLDGGDDRMQAAVYAHGKLWAASDTIVKTPVGSSQVGAVYYVIDPSGPAVVKQGYLSLRGDSVTRPSLGVTSAGKAVIGVTLAGPDYFPSAAYATLDDSAGSAPAALAVAAAGPVPADGFTGYSQFQGSGVERWGDYGYAAADGNAVWIANEWIPGIATAPDIANWSTFVSRVTP